MIGNLPVRACEGMHIVDGTLIVPAPADVSDEALFRLKRGILDAVHTAHIRRVILDVSRITFLDRILFSILADAARMAELLGAKTVFVGFQPGVVSALIDMDVACDDLLCAITLEDGLALHRTLQTILNEREVNEDETGDIENELIEEPGENENDGNGYTSC